MKLGKLKNAQLSKQSHEIGFVQRVQLIKAQEVKKSFKQSMLWLHTWSGLVVGWLLFVIFVTGTSAYYKDEITLWMKPSLHHHSKQAIDALEPSLYQAIKYFENKQNVVVDLPGSRSNVVSISYREQTEGSGKGKKVTLFFDAFSGEEIQTRQTFGGEFLYNFHFELFGLPKHMARWIVGIATISMLVAVITGILIHSRIFKDIFVFRPKKALRSWMDLHILPAIAVLPFFLIITYSGLLLFMHLMMPWGISVLYDNKTEFKKDMMQLMSGSISRESIQSFEGKYRTKIEYKHLENILNNAKRLLNDDIGGYALKKQKNNQIQVEVYPKKNISIFDVKHNKRGLIFDATSGELLYKKIPESNHSFVLKTYWIFESIHRAKFADSWIRFLFFLSGVAGIVVVASGLILWVEKRKQKYHTNHHGIFLVQKLNIGTVVGVFIAIGAYFAANKIIPFGVENRDKLELLAFFLAWALSYVHAFVQKNNNAWVYQLYFVGVLYLCIPFLTIEGFESYSTKHTIYVLFDIYFVVTALIFLCTAQLLRNKNMKGT
jgi:uncharacterized iron-regulated membrane protein